MNKNTLLGLGIVALIALGIAVALNRSTAPQSEGTGEKETYLAPGLRDHMNDVDKIVMTGAGDKIVATFVRGANGWTLAERGNYDVDTGKLRDFLLKLADAKLVEQKTANKDKYTVLGVQDVSGADAKGMQIELSGLAQPLKLIVGDVNARGDGTFVRSVGEAQSWLASGALAVEKNPVGWLKKDLIDIPADRIAAVNITHADGKSVGIYKNAASDADFKVVDVPKGREVGAEFAVNGVAAVLAALHFDDVMPAKETTPDEHGLKARFVTFDGMVVDMTAWEKDGKVDVRLNASVDSERATSSIVAAIAKAKTDYESAAAAAEAAKKDGKDAQAAEAPIKPLAVSDPDKDRENRRAALDKEAADLNARFNDRIFVLPAYKYANINKSIDDLSKPLEEKASTDAAKEAKEKKPINVVKEKKPVGVMPTGATKEKKPTIGAVKEKKPAEATEEKKPAGAAEEKKPIDTTEEKKSAGTTEEKKPADATEEKKPTDTAEEKKPADAMDGKKSIGAAKKPQAAKPMNAGAVKKPQATKPMNVGAAKKPQAAKPMNAGATKKPQAAKPMK
ncbi:MAG: DUF4340 domain-containing protein [Rhodanobacter sp.]|jgi:hypothetical protein|nr:DUF4340 domain-containing protein [Rhodanobacter sp.]